MPRQRQQTLQFEPYRNSALFSSHWLENRLRLEPEWTEHRADAEIALSRLAALWERERNRVERYGTEAPLEHAFIQPVLELLGWKLHYQTFLQGRKPDYALFLTDADHDAALATERRSADFWEHVAVVADAKAWDVSLDRPAISEGQREFPPQQIEWYIDRSRRDFGILTNGQRWRLYPRDREAHQRRFETYYEFNLPEFLREFTARPMTPPELVDDFLYLYLLFSPVAFRERPDRKPLIARALEGSSAYRIGIGEDLRSRAFEAVRLSTEGFLSFSTNRLRADNGDHLELCRRESFVLVYRLLFIMFAEDRGLLPFGTNRLYTANRSLRRYRDEIATIFDRNDADRTYKKTKHAVLDDLRLLFDLVNTGQGRYGVPPYNGGLFDPEAHPFLERMQISDWHLARAIDYLGRAKDPSMRGGDLFRVDYRDLAIQHLGSIYEALLELVPRIATTRMVVVAKRTRERTEERTIPESHPVPDGYERTDINYEVGQVFLQTSKGERRASGSYYTPDHIVNHIVEKTLGPICRRVSDTLRAEIDQQTSDSEIARLQTEFDDRLLRLRVVDPAMGSGHFLLRACAFLAEEIATHPWTADETVQQSASTESALVYWKRRVAENCLYGVDLNDLAVELAKLAMWLETVAADQPLTFLSHHLRHGNSLIGGNLGVLGALPDAPPLHMKPFQNAFNEKLPLLLGPLTKILRLPSDDVRQVKEKEKLLKSLDRARQAFRDAADVWASTFVLPEAERIDPDDYRELVDEVGHPRRFAALLAKGRFQRALSAARRGAVSPFHWEIEFPEVYFDGEGRRVGAGFDAVIGNPPYDVLSELETGHDLSILRAVVARDPAYRPSHGGKNNLYKLFVCRGLELLADDGYLGFITPMAILGDAQAAELRRAILAAGTFTDVDSFPQKDDPRNRVFPEAKLSTAVVVLRKARENGSVRFTCRVHPGRELGLPTGMMSVARDQIPLYDPMNFTIVSCDQSDFDIATRIVGSGRMRRLSDLTEFFQGEVNETIQMRKRTVSRGETAQFQKFVTRGASICLYVYRAPSQGNDLYLDVEAFLDSASDDGKAFHFRYPRIVLQESSPQNNFRRIIAAWMPAGEFCNHTINYCPQHKCDVDLRVLLAVLNTKLADWYFRIGSTNAHVSHYQLYNLPFPRIADGNSSIPARTASTIRRNLDRGNLTAALDCIRPFTESPPFDPGIAAIICHAVDRITAIEAARGDIARSERSALAPQAQPYQDFLDRLFYQLAGLTEAEAAGLEDRLSRML
ncbi:MAG: N-6 DNA methylase [Planctomycetaceae bacterium]